ncbi:hypothetical protein [Sinomonas flava]|uniref:Uncharacterized protein n=1 Tax=Sinomonas flava TaxID=496857 RepID=A0ABN3BUB0_9MICC
MQKITTADLAAEDIELLPSRDTMLANLGSLNWALVGATNTALAANVLTIGSVATAGAVQSINVIQG